MWRFGINRLFANYAILQKFEAKMLNLTVFKISPEIKLVSKIISVIRIFLKFRWNKFSKVK